MKRKQIPVEWRSVLKERALDTKRRFDCSYDDMVCNPVIRLWFVMEVVDATGFTDEETILRSLLNLRRASELSPVSA